MRKSKEKIRKKRNTKIFAITQIASLMLEIIAFAFLFSLGLGLSVGGVSAAVTTNGEKIYLPAGSASWDSLSIGDQVRYGDKLYAITSYTKGVGFSITDTMGYSNVLSLDNAAQQLTPISLDDNGEYSGFGSSGVLSGAPIPSSANVADKASNFLMNGFPAYQRWQTLPGGFTFEGSTYFGGVRISPDGSTYAIPDASSGGATYVQVKDAYGTTLEKPIRIDSSQITSNGFLGGSAANLQTQNSYIPDEDGNLWVQDSDGVSTGVSAGTMNQAKAREILASGQTMISREELVSDASLGFQSGRAPGTTTPTASTRTPLDTGPTNYSIFGLTTVNWGGWGHLGGNLIEGVTWAGAVLGIVSGFASLLGDENQELIEPLGQALAAGILAGKGAYGLIKSLAATNHLSDTSWLARNAGYVSVGIGLVTAYLVLANNYEDTETKQQTVQFQCLSWQAPRGGADCDKCNGDPLRPCSEYRCRALGQTCKLINAGTGKEKCIDGSIDDVTSPGIKPDPDVLTQGYSYADVTIRPPGGKGPAGMTIVSEEGSCLKAFTPFTFGIITTDNGKNGVETQPAQCKIDMKHTNKMDEMQYYMGADNLFVERHNESISLPGTAVLNAQFPDFKNDGEYAVYIRCRDGNGNENRDEFEVKFCIDKTPDLTAPVIKTTSIPSGSPVLYKVDNLSLNVYTNEPATCKWGRRDADYSNMENNMVCNNAVWEMNAESLYTCEAELTGIKDKETNQFYFRCQDLSNNVMQEGYSYTLEGTQPLNILKVAPNGTIGGSTSTVTTSLEVQTDNGYQNGNSDCYYSPDKDSGFIKFFETSSNVHKQPLDLTDGYYTYYLRCTDAGGNTDNSSVSFKIFVDRYAPATARVYSLESKLVVITDEDSSCSYSTSSCNFDLSKNEGVSMPYPNSINHYAEWKTDQTYYIKCADKYGNSPNPNECSIIVRPYELKSY